MTREEILNLKVGDEVVRRGIPGPRNRGEVVEIKDRIDAVPSQVVVWVCWVERERSSRYDTASGFDLWCMESWSLAPENNDASADG